MLGISKLTCSTSCITLIAVFTFTVPVLKFVHIVAGCCHLVNATEAKYVHADRLIFVTVYFLAE